MSFTCLRVSVVASVLLLTMVSLVETSHAEIPWQQSPETTFNSARASGKPILVYVGTEWCHFCEQMKRDTWSDPHVAAVVSRSYETLMLDGDRDKRVVKKLGLNGYPVTLLYDSGGHFVAKRDGFMLPAQTLRWIKDKTP
ncbi:MAG: thioredoxin family protein [Rubripirellula sp.]